MIKRIRVLKSFVVSNNIKKNKVIIIIGVTKTGKSRLSIDLVTRFPIEIINSDKIQVYKGLDIVNNKGPISERLGMPHHLMGQVEQDVDYSSVDFCRNTIAIIETILKSNRVPIIVGVPRLIYLKSIDQMADYNRGVRRAIGVLEIHEYFLSEAKLDNTRKDALLASSIEKIKENTYVLTRSQLLKIFDATSALEKIGEMANRAPNEVLWQPCMELHYKSLEQHNNLIAFNIAWIPPQTENKRHPIKRRRLQSTGKNGSGAKSTRDSSTVF
ncbi:hypothetical protein M9H77_06612 [Catharanthus roseus]|uniref:Uncharacterized protein n=1 Tax=Catharanthus roseus TaxID=4058 RepID=A0ACC0BSV1_CATRO|nr:hypothetical protein M9H77_06612 [Catharanthus roseus]